MFQQIVHEQTFEQDMEGMTVVMVAEMAEFMDEDIVLKYFRQTDEVQVEVYVSLCRTAAPVGGVVLVFFLLFCDGLDDPLSACQEEGLY